MTHDYATIEALASRICHDSGGTWDKKRTKRNHWRAKAKAQLDYTAFTRNLYFQNLPHNRIRNFMVWLRRVFS